MKTDAPWSVIWHVFREWIRQKAPVTEGNIKPGSIAYRLLGLGDRKGKEGVEGEKGEGEKVENRGGDKGKVEHEGGEAAGEKKDAVQEKKPDAAAKEDWMGEKVELKEVVFDEQLGRYKDKGKYVRYQQNPRENWGPMNRAKGK
jgi:tRNA (guanine26-N2/guanine27-N2)-dimethyltransferase